MRFALLAEIAGLASLSQAFLLPTGVSSSDIDIVNTLPFEHAVGIEDGRLLRLECPGCPLKITHEKGMTKVADFQTNFLQLNFSISHSGGDTLLLNDLEVYPYNPLSEIWMGGLKADQLLMSTFDKWDYASSTRLGYSLSLQHVAEGSTDDQLGLLAVHLKITDLDGIAVDGLPVVDVKIVETASGKLMIADAGVLPVPHKAEKECTNILCRWRVYLKDRLSKMKGCAGMRRPHQGHAMKKPSGDHDNMVHSHHRPHGPHHPHRHHHKLSGFSRFLRIVVLRVLIPVIMGLVLGATASVVGIVVGHLSICIWRTLFRRGERPSYTRVDSEDSTGDEGKETTSFIEQQDAPPVYEDAPVYEEIVTIQKPSE